MSSKKSTELISTCNSLSLTKEFQFLNKEADSVYMVELRERQTETPTDLSIKNDTNDLNKYSTQLDQMKIANSRKHSGFLKSKNMNFYQTNDRQNVSLVTRQKLLQLS